MAYTSSACSLGVYHGLVSDGKTDEREAHRHLKLHAVRRFQRLLTFPLFCCFRHTLPPQPELYMPQFFASKTKCLRRR